MRRWIIDKCHMMRKTVLWTTTVVITILNLEGFVFGDYVSCKYCGMRTELCRHSWVVIHYDDRSIGEFCSLHCTSIDMALNTDKTGLTILVGDYYTHKLIDADKAYWVVGGNKTGVMTTRAKWAFKERKEAERFMAEHGGETATFDTALQAAVEDMYGDILLIQERRKLMRQRKIDSNVPSK